MLDSQRKAEIMFELLVDMRDDQYRWLRENSEPNMYPGQQADIDATREAIESINWVMDLFILVHDLEQITK